MTSIKSLLALIGGFLGWFFGGFDGFLYLLIIFVAVDYITGVMAALFKGKVSSTAGAKGILKKILIFLLVGVANGLDVILFKSGETIRTAVIFFYLANEGISILENAGAMGVPIPKVLKKAFLQLKED